MENNDKSRISPLAGKQATADLLINITTLLDAYYDNKPDTTKKEGLVSFGTSGHRGSSIKGTFLEAHVIAITQAIVDYRKNQDINGPLFLGIDTHALSEVAEKSVLQVLTANGIKTCTSSNTRYTPTPAISHAILNHNLNNKYEGLSDGIVITPSHNPPQDAGIKYNPPHGGPAESKVTKEIEEIANRYLINNNKDVKLLAREMVLASNHISPIDIMGLYVNNLDKVINLKVIKDKGITIGVHPLGGASIDYWKAIQKKHQLKIVVVDDTIDPTFRFMSLDHDGKIRMDCSSSYAMANLIKLKDLYDIAIGNDPDADRHGIVTPSGGLLNPNHYLTVAIDYLFRNRPDWPRDAGVGKTVVSSSLIDRVVAGLNRTLYEVPVGFKWFADGLLKGSLGFAGEESAGASFLGRDGDAWSTDKDGIILGLLAAEIKAQTGSDPYIYFQNEIVSKYGCPTYSRIDSLINPDKRDKLSNLTPEMLKLITLGDEKVESISTKAGGNNENIGGIIISTQNSWIAIRPSGTEPIVKIYGESWKGAEHLIKILSESEAALWNALDD